jgi:uncharacterized Zn-binding protein involved in type VI secretion
LAAICASCCSRSRSNTVNRPTLFHLTSTEAGPVRRQGKTADMGGAATQGQHRISFKQLPCQRRTGGYSTACPRVVYGTVHAGGPALHMQQVHAATRSSRTCCEVKEHDE